MTISVLSGSVQIPQLALSIQTPSPVSSLGQLARHLVRGIPGFQLLPAEMLLQRWGEEWTGQLEFNTFPSICLDNSSLLRG